MLSDDEKAVFRTAFEIDQRWVIELAADRTPLICQSQSLNLYLPATSISGTCTCCTGRRGSAA